MATCTFVLIHGGGTTSGYWDRLLPHLDEPAVAVDLPGRAGRPFDPMSFTVDDGVRSIVADVSATTPDDELVLVAHSSGGLFAPGIAAALAPRVRHIVLNAASVPPEGGLGLDCMKPSHRARCVEGMDAARREGRVLATPGPPEHPEELRRTYPDLPDDLLAFLAEPSRWCEDSMNVYFQPVLWAAVADVPLTYIKNLRDRAVPPDLQNEMIARLPNARVVELDSDHIAAVTQPEALAAILNSVASSSPPA